MTSVVPTPSPAPDLGAIDAPWLARRLRGAAQALGEAATAPDAVRALHASVPTTVAPLLGLAALDGLPPLRAVLRTVVDLTRPGARTDGIAELLALGAELVEASAAAITDGRRPDPAAPAVATFAAVAHRLRRPTGPAPLVPSIATLVAPDAPGAAAATRGPQARQRFVEESQGLAEHLRLAVAAGRSAADAIAADAAITEVTAIAERLAALASSYDLGPVARCLAAAAGRARTGDPKALWVLDEAGVELADPVDDAEGLMHRFAALATRLDGTQPPPGMGGFVAAPPQRRPGAAPGEDRTGPALASLLAAGIDGLAAAPDPPTDAPPGIARIDELEYRGPAALAAATALGEALRDGTRPTTAAALDEMHDLLRLARG